MRSLGGWLLILAIAAGIGYAFYVIKLSGSSVERLAVELEERRAPAGEVGPVALDPSMNPLRAALELELRSLSNRKELFRHEVALMSSAGKVLWEEVGNYRQSDRAAEKTSRRTRAITVPVKTFEVEEAGDYRLRLSMRPRKRVDIISATVDIRQNVARFDPVVLFVIAAVAVLGLLAGIFGKKRRN